MEVSASVHQLVWAAAVGLAAWFIKDFLFGLYQKRAALERHEWEYRLKDVYCPLYYWSGVLMFDTAEDDRIRTAEALNAIMAKAAYAIPEGHYYTFVRLVENAYGQQTTRVEKEQIVEARKYLLNHIEALTALLYRMEASGGVGDPATSLDPYRRTLRFALVAVTQLLVWAIVGGAMWGVLWLWGRHDLTWVGALGIALLVVLWVDVRQRDSQRRDLRKRLAPDVQQ